MYLLMVFIYIPIYLISANQDLVENGRAQFQLLKEKGNLPHYGSCWKQGIEHLEQGCKYLTEDTQSEIALHFTNCFLKMSGHDTYNCDSDKKRNLRAICINNMSDRGFNVYTEFYTHIQNICGFLQGYVWNEIIAENTLTVGNKLKETARNQEGLLQAQKESLELQEKMLKHGRILENVLEDLFKSSELNRDVLKVLTITIDNLQKWIIGEMSWFDSIVFYTSSVILVFVFTSTKSTSSARLIILFFLLINFIIERLISYVYLIFSAENPSTYIWLSRYTFMAFSAFLLGYFAFTRIDPFKKQYELLYSIQEQNNAILNLLKGSDDSFLINVEAKDLKLEKNSKYNLRSRSSSIEHSII